jgi:Tol biopolymer transport system component
VTLRSLFTLGISGGLVPCPDAITILLVAVAVNRIPFGMLLIVSFSVGLALVLIGIGIAMVNGVRLIARSDLLARFGVYTPLLSAVVVSGLGVGLTWSALNSLKFSAAVTRAPAGAAVATGSPAPASPAPTILETSRLLYIAADSNGWDQLFMQPLSGGQAVQLTSDSSGITGYSLSPDRKTILYTVFGTGGGTAIWALSADGTGRRLALDCPQSECNSPRWYPDGQKIAYDRLDNAQDATVPRFSIWWLDLGSGKTQPVFQDQSFASYAPQFSPDGQWLSYISTADNTLIIFSLRDGHTLSVPLGLQAAIPQSWSPNGEALLFGREAQDGTSLHIQTYALSTHQTIDLGGPKGATDYSAAWSPDGQWIAIDRNIASDATQSNNQVWLVKPDGTQAHVLLKEPGASYSSLTWSPDARFLLYSRYVLDLSGQTHGRFDIYAADISTGESRVLVTGGDMPTLLP